MPLYMVERNFAEALEQVTKDDVEGIKAVNVDEGVRWLFSFLSADKKKTYCLYEAPNPEAIQEAARRAGVPVDEIVEVAEQLSPESDDVHHRIRPGAFV